MRNAFIAALLATGIFYAMAEQQNDHEGHAHDAGEQCAEACALPSHATTQASEGFRKTEEEWQRLLDPEAFRVMRQHGTEPPFRNAYWNSKDKGLYLCAGCQAPLFASKQKYDSGTGWPSFSESIAPENVGESVDTSYGMRRVEVHCSRCGGHLGHVFEDGPRPKGLRYCINSASLQFVPHAEIQSGPLADFAEHAR